MAIQPGTRLGPYEIVAPIGAGGMGEVYRAKDTRLDRLIAIKILSAEFAQNAQLKIRFEREAKAISQLNHPNICTLHDVGHESGVDYLVMELLEGESLADRLAKGPLPIDQVLRHGREIASALDRAHREGIIHRDLKPGNVVITKSGAKLLDFGLAKSGVTMQPSGDFIEGATVQKPLTQEGTVVGTFQYMAPEQIGGEATDARTDIFALGAVLYEMLTGTAAFRGKNRTSIIAAIISGEPQPISSIQPLTPPALDRVIRTCLAKDPDDRWQTAHDVMLQLQWIEEGGSQAGIAAPVLTRRRQRERLSWIVAAVAVVIAAVEGAAWIRARKVQSPVMRVSISPGQKTSFNFNLEDSGSLTISPDGRFVTFPALGEGGKKMLWLRPIDALAAQPIAGTEGAIFPFWSPDSRFIAFFAEGKLKKVDLTGAPPLTVCDAPSNPRSGSWNKDGTIIFSPSSIGPVHKVSAAGGKSVAVTKLDESAAETTHRWASFLPDGRHFLYMAGTHTSGSKSETNAIYLGSIDAPSERKLLLHARSNAVYASGYLLYVRDRILVAQPFNPRSLAFTGDPVPVAQDVRYDTSFFRAVFSASENGVLVYQSGSGDAQAQLAWYDRAGKQLSPIGEPGNYGDLSLSPDSTRIAMSVEDPTTGTTDIWLYDLGRNVRTRFTFNPLDEDSPVWSPDGSQVAYSASEPITQSKVTRDLFVKAANGTGREELILKTEALKVPTSWSPDGRYLAFDSATFFAQAKRDIWLLPLSGDRKPIPFLQTQYDEHGAQFSPDGRWIIYASDESGKSELYLVPFPNAPGKWQVSTNGGSPGDWRADGREILYATPRGQLTAVPIETTGGNVRIGTPSVLFDVADVVGATGKADHQRFILARRPHAEENQPINLVANWPAAVRK